MKIVVASGKGGTGKTTVAVNLAASLKNVFYVDCDVEEPNGHLLLKPEISHEDLIYKKVPALDADRCIACGKCSEVCEFNAILFFADEPFITGEMCHGCGACTYFCPQKALMEENAEIGKIRSGKSGDVSFIDGILNIGEASAVPLIKALKRKCIDEKMYIFDAPPGTACSMVETAADADYCLLVTESTPFGLHDLKLAINVLKQLQIPFGILINKYSPAYRELEMFLTSNEYDVILKIPYNDEASRLYSDGRLLIEKDFYAGLFTQLFDEIIARITRGNIYEQ